MRVHKAVNRVHRGTVYYRWILTVRPKDIRALGWVDGQRLDVFVQGGSLTLQPARYPLPVRPTKTPGALHELALEKTGRPRGSRSAT